MEQIPKVFLAHAANVLGDTDRGLSGAWIAKLMSDYAVRFNRDIPYSSKFPMVVTKRSALLANLECFEPPEQYQIIRNLCEHPSVRDKEEVVSLKATLISRFRQLDTSQVEDFSIPGLIESTKHWLSSYPESLKLYNEAIVKYQNNLFSRNLLDDLRLSLETLLRSLLKNGKTLENQTEPLGKYMSTGQSSKEVRNMILKLLEYYANYQNTYVKHDDNVLPEEIGLILEMTSAFMHFLVKIDHG